MSTTAVDNDDANSNITFTIKDTDLYVPVVILPAKGNQKLTKPFSKLFERFVYWNEYKTKSENENTTNEYRYFLISDFVRVNALFVLIYLNRDKDVKQLKTQRYLPKYIKKNYNVTINGKNFSWPENWFWY